MRLAFVQWILGVSALVAVAGCSSGTAASPSLDVDSGVSPSDGGGAAPSDAEGAPDAVADDAGGGATFTEVYSEIINGAPDCNGCHEPPSPTGDLDMSSQATAYANLVGKPATAAPKCASATQLLVDPGNASDSLLYLKVTNPPCGSQMPLNGPVLTAPQVQLIESWINAGARND
jgi:hypothetical protein